MKNTVWKKRIDDKREAERRRLREFYRRIPEAMRLNEQANPNDLAVALAA